MEGIKHALIMAAGRGQRMMPMTDSIPKAMAQLDGNSLIVNGIRKVVKLVDQIHITVGYKKSMLASHVIQENVASVINTEGHGNSWWVYHSLLAQLDEPVLVLTCDNVTDIDLPRLVDDYKAQGSPPCMLVPVKPIPGLEGDYIFLDGQRVTKLSRQEVSPQYCSGIQIINPHKINSQTQETEDFNELWSQLIKVGALTCSRVFPSRWFSFDTEEQLKDYKKHHPG